MDIEYAFGVLSAARCDECEYMQAIETLSHIVEKHKAKKPVVKNYTTPGYGDWTTCRCPECEAIVVNSDNYCDKCGQKIDWSEITNEK